MDYTEKHTIEIDGREITFEVYDSIWSFVAVEENYDGPEDKYRYGSGETPEEAIADLVEKMTEFISMYPEYLKD